ncbi:P-loop containing nucleoside triphosphate hydrolases superfamily protein [Artemisia annua]|uniref:P-loop containing nucleoside triphosphate hydrolases superfamily protein n=1 Tax=Artemisia annua TaxID=35608 RepID=A0A2U1PWM3_ARTAN|nr:P-loop containing nucleoside triphosphate hydrolases superfamily protein [Artemisia annua]
MTRPRPGYYSQYPAMSGQDPAIPAMVKLFPAKIRLCPAKTRLFRPWSSYFRPKSGYVRPRPGYSGHGQAISGQYPALSGHDPDIPAMTRLFPAMSRIFRPRSGYYGQYPAMSGHDPNRSPLQNELNLDRLLAKMWEAMGLVRVYTKPQGQQPDFSDPVVLSTDRGGCSVEDFCNQIHRSLGRKSNMSWYGAQVQGIPLSIVALVMFFRMRMLFRSSRKRYDCNTAMINTRGYKVGCREKESEGRGRFKTHTTGPDRIADRVKKAPLKN